MTPASSNVVIARNPATGAELGRVPATPPEAVEAAVVRARSAQCDWGARPWPERCAALAQFWAELARAADAWSDAIRAEVGKPRGEAMAEVVAALDAIRWTVRHGGQALADERLGPGWQRFLLVPSAWVRYRPIGVVGIVGTWNYPLLLNAPVIAQALAAGNAIVWKPSELAALAGERLQHGVEAAGIPEGLVAAVFGGPEVGRALAESDLDKGVFTGGVAGGRRVLETLAARGVPAVAELSGFDAAIVLPDAPVEPSARALAWGAFVGSGQTCVAVKRLYVVGDARPWAEALAERARNLRVGDPVTGTVDLGPMISEAARDRLDAMVKATVAAGARIVHGGEPLEGPGWFYRPTVLLAETAEPEAALTGAFGPVVLVRGVRDADAAIDAANASPFGLAASVWGRDLRAAQALARRLDAGMVAVNDAVTPSAHASAPFGGMKASGFGRTRGVLGLREFTQPQALQVRSPGGFRPQLFPYSDRLERILHVYRGLFHPRSRPKRRGPRT
jgi:acyl-CoA reductase-like NAD-dependent aldehyde dehydrogenase